MNELTKFQAYCDASGVFDHQFQSIGTVSGGIPALDDLRSVLAKIIKDNGIREIKFANITKRDSRDYNAALAAFTVVITGYCRYNRVRADVMTWDTTDSRHAVPGRNDSDNLGRLYHHLLLNVTKRWSEGEWNLIVDKNERIDFTALKGSINCKLPLSVSMTLPEIIESTDQLEELEVVKTISEIASHEEPLVQLADLFAGISRFSHERGAECCVWLSSKGNPDQPPLPDLVVDGYTEPEFTKATECRFQLIGELNTLCKKYRLGVSLESEKRLWTPNPNNPVNFWHYTPQGGYDKAPTG